MYVSNSMNNINKYSVISNNKRPQAQATITRQPSFTGAGAGATKVTSKYFNPLKEFMKPVTTLVTKMYDGLTTGIAHTESAVLGSKVIKNTIEFSDKKNFDVIKHISALNGVIIGGVYIYKTMKNDKLDADKRVTLSINQGIVAAVATVAGYTVESLLGKAVDNYSRKFLAANVKATKDEFSKLKGGLRVAVPMMVFGLMYRYIAPVLVTPIANKIGNNIHDKKSAKKKAEMVQNDSAEPKPQQAKEQEPSQVVKTAVAFANAPAAGSNRPILQTLMATQKFS